METGKEQCRQAIRILREQLRCDFAGIAFVHGVNRPLLTWIYATGSQRGGYQRVVVSPGKGVAGRVYDKGKAIVIQQFTGHPIYENIPNSSIAAAEQLESFAALPLKEEGKVCGVLLAGYRMADRVDAETYDQVLSLSSPQFCGFDVPAVPYNKALYASGKKAQMQQVPVYELLTDHIIQARENERQRISRELHDGIVQDLLGVQMMLRTVKHKEKRDEMLETVDQAETNLSLLQKQLRDLAVSLRPVILDDLGLTAALRSYFKGVEEQRSMEILFTENISEQRYPRNIETVFYRICQEAVTNACKYAGCDRIRVSLLQIGKYLNLEVADDGVGFDPEDKTRSMGIGLRSMVERAELIDGQFTLDTTPEKGTCVCLFTETQALGRGGMET